MSEIECPYCELFQQVDHDDGYGYEEGVLHEQECTYCKRTFVYETSLVYSYEASKCPCKNGEPHNLEDIKGYPVEFFVGKKRCSYCGEEILVDVKAYQESMEAYRKDCSSR